jgi:hypothetical protein
MHRHNPSFDDKPRWYHYVMITVMLVFMVVDFAEAHPPDPSAGKVSPWDWHHPLDETPQEVLIKQQMGCAPNVAPEFCRPQPAPAPVPGCISRADYSTRVLLGQPVPWPICRGHDDR